MKRLCGILLALAGLFLYAPCAAQNTRVRGTVTDAQTGEPIPYAVVLFPGTTTGITTDDEGFYSLESRDTSSYIRAEMVSYEPQIRPIPAGSDNRVDFRLNPTHLEIGNVVVTPGDNPAHPILAGIVRNKKYNDPEEYDRYICRTYTKMELGLANVREFRSRKLQQNFGFIFEHIDTSDVTGQPYLRSILSWDHLRKKWKVGVKAGYIHTWMAYDYERELGNGKMEKMIRSRSTINTFFGQVDGEYYLGEKWLFTATVSAHQHLVRSIDKNIIPMDNQQPTDPNGNKTKVPVGYDKGRIELSGYVSIRYRPTERLGLSIGLREEMFGSEWTPIIPAFFTDYLISKRGNLVAKASISRNYRFPSLNDLYFLPGGNPDLKKEHGFTYDAGLSFATGRDGVYTLRGEATWFDSYIDNWIVWLPTAKGFWTPKNVKEVHAYGVEVKAGLDVQLAKDWQLSADGNFSWTPSINHGDPVDWYDKAIGKQLVYIPEFSASVTGHLTYRSWRFTYKWCYYSERFTTSDNDMKTKIGRVKPYFMSDISLEKAFSFRWADLSLKGVINNLFNEEYQSVLSRPMPRLNYEIFLDIRPKWGKRNKKQ